MVYILCVVHLLGCCELNFFVDKYYPSDSQSVPGKDMNKMCNIISRLLALGTASLFSRVKSGITHYGQLFDKDKRDRIRLNDAMSPLT